jgi:predicted amidohydrolase YtcJ
MRADLVFTNGAVYTVDGAHRWAQAVAVADGRIVAVGTTSELRGYAARAKEVVDLHGRMLLPGFQDAHVHPVQGGMERMRCDLTGSVKLEDYLKRVGDYAMAHPETEWILGGGWSMEAFPGGIPSAGMLDGLVQDRPVFLPNRDHHSAWVNTRALKLAGIDRETPDPPDGRIERDTAGRPTGALHEGAMALVGRHVPSSTNDQVRQGLLTGQAYLHSLGITGWQDALVGTGLGMPDSLATYLELAGDGRLTARVAGALWWDRERGIEQIPELTARRSSAGRFTADTIKIMQDGVCETFTAALLTPYLDEHGRPTTNTGISFIEPESLETIVVLLDAAGFQLHVHALGDRGVREALNAVEAARRANGPNDHRHHLAHLQIVHPDDRPRFRRLGVVANCQPLWACLEPQMTDLTIPFLGPERTAQQYPFASLAHNGAQLAFGSDWPVSTPDPLAELHVAVNRTDPDEPQDPFLPAECLSLPEALHAFTMGSAYVSHREKDTGSIEVGKYADLVVLDRNLFEHDNSQIAEAKVQLTLVEGEAVHEAPDL